MKQPAFKNRRAQQVRTGLLTEFATRGRTPDGGYTAARIPGKDLAETLAMDRKRLHRAVENLNMALLEKREGWRVGWTRCFATGYTYWVEPRPNRVAVPK